MQLVVNVAAGFLILVCVVSALGDVAKVPSLVDTMTRLGIPAQFLPVLGAIKVVLALAAAIGFAVNGVAIAAAGGLVVYFAGAVIAHTRVKDSLRDSGAAFVLLAVSGFYLLTALAV
ncbi:MAG: hypothetical protein RIR69_1551 [Actinomycetota bacterium]|jgi:hypothetical protein